ncbi:DUF4347 domain-containing protein [Massilia sp. UMI-21]|nr:DUF4347 domain-containing protein [Massilia sp. UMI-21]
MPEQSTAPRQEIAFVNGNLADLQTLIAGMRPDIEIILLDPAGDGLAQIARTLAGRADLDAIHLIGHGASGLLALGDLTLDAAYLKQHADVLADIGAALAEDGDILLYGCDTGAGSAGAQFLQTLAQATGADVAASDDATGGAAAGGDWKLEVTAGQVDSAAAIADGAAWSPILALSAGTVHTYGENTWAFSSLAQDAAGNIYLAHKLDSTAISLKQWNGSAWTELTQLTTAMTGDTSFSDDLDLKVDADGNLDLMFRHAKNVTSGIDSLRGIKFGEFDMGTRTWTTTLVEQSSHPSGWLNYDDPSMTIDAAGRLHVVYNFDDASVHDYYIRYATSADGGASWATSTVLKTTIDGVDELKDPTVEVDGAGNVHLFYIREDNQNTYYGNLYYATKAAGSSTWSASTKIADALTSAFTMATDGAGHFHIGYSLRTTNDQNVTTGSKLNILSNASGSWSTETALQDARTNSIGGLQLADGKLHMLVNSRTLDRSATEIYVMREDAGTWQKGYQGEAVLPALSTESSSQYFAERSFLVKEDGTIMVVAEDGGTPNLRNIYFTAGSSSDFGLVSNAAPVVSDLHGDTTAFTPGADPMLDGAYIDDQMIGDPVAVTDADSSDFDGGALTISRSSGTADGSFVFDFVGSGLLAFGSDSNSADGTIHAGDKLFLDVGGVWIEIGQVDALRDGQAGRDLVIHFSGANATPAAAEELIKFMMFTAPSAGQRVFSLTVDDGAGGVSVPASFAMTGRDVVAPAVTDISSSTANGVYKAGAAILIQVQFSEAVLVTGAPTLLLDNGGVATHVGGSGDTLVFSYTVQAGQISPDLDVAGTGALQLNGGSIQDAAGNTANLTLPAPGTAGSLGANKAIAVDGAAPTDIALSNAAITTLDGAHAVVGTLSSVDANAQDSFSYSLVSGAGATDNAAFEIAGGVLRALDAATLGDGARSVRVRTTDAAGNTYEEAFSIAVSSPPTVAISASQATLGAGGAALVTFTFSKTPHGFDAADITVSGGSLGALAVDPQNDKVYTATFTPAPDQQNLAAAISVGAGKFADADGLVNVASTVNVAIGGDTLAPSLSITADRTSFKAGQSATVTFSFSEAPVGFDAADIVTSGGSLGGLAATADSKVYTASFTPSAGLDSLSGAIAVAGAGFADAYGNAGSDAAELAIGGDTRAPVVSEAHIAVSGASGANGTFVAGDTVTVSWNDGATGDDNGDTAGASVDFSSFGGPAAVAATLADGVWSAGWLLAAGTLDASGLTVSVTARDAAGNTGTRADDSNAAADTQAPAVSSGAIVLSGASGIGGAYRVGDVVTATWNNGQDGNLDVAAVSVDFSQFGGSTVAASASGNVWSASYTIAAGNIDLANRNVIVSVTDDAGQATLRGGAGNVSVDTVLPRVTDISVAGAPAANATGIDYTVVFDDAVTGVDLADFGLSATGSATGILAGISGAGKVWTVSVAGIGGNGSLALTLNAGGTGIADDAGNLLLAGYAEGAAHTVAFNAAPVITSNGGGADAAFGIAEKQRAVTTVAALDADGHALGYSIGGADAALFEIDPATGVLRFKATPLHADPLDSDHDNIYDLTVSVDDGHGAQDSQTLRVTVLGDLDGDGIPDTSDSDIDNDGRPNSMEDPVPGAYGVTGDGNGDGVPDSAQLNVASLPTVVQGAPFATLEVAAGLSLTSVGSLPAAGGLPRNVKMPVGQFDFTIGGVAPGATAEVSIYVDSSYKVNGYYKLDAGNNWVNLATSVLTVGSKTKLSFSLTDGGIFDSDGLVNGSISDPGGLVTIAPAITSNGGAVNASVEVEEGATGVTTVQANQGARYAISGGLDAALFQIDAGTGTLRFVSAPAYGAPKDAGGDNVYDVQVTASDAFGSDTQALAVRVTAAPPAPPTVIDGVKVDTSTRDNADGSTSQVITIPVVEQNRNETVGNNTVADIPLVSSGGGTVLSAQVPTGVGLQVSGSAAPGGVADAITNLIREIKGVTAAGSHDQAQMTGGGSGFLSSLPQDANLLVQTVVPTVAPGAGAAGPLVIQGAVPGTGGPLSALVIDAKGLPAGSTILLQNVDFAAIVGSVTVTGGAGAQTVWGDGASQTIMLGEDDDVLHGGAGNDSVGSAGGNDKVYGDEGDDIVFGGLGDDLVDGGSGFDTVQLVGSGRADYTARFVDGHLVLAHGKDGGGADGTDIVANVEALRFTNAAADTSVRGSIERLYEAVLGRDADTAGVDAWLAAVGKGASLLDVAADMLASGEAQLQAGGDADFVTALYSRSLERSVDAGGLQYWTDALAAGTVSRAGLTLLVAESAEKLAKPVSLDIEVGDTDIGTLVRLYATLFDRAPDSAGINHWLSLSEAGVSLDRIADHFLASDEAVAAYGALDNRAFTAALYQQSMHRSGSDVEVSYWTGLLDNGSLDRGDVLLQFAESNEKVSLVGVVGTSLDGAPTL